MAGYGIRAFLIAQSLNQIEKAYGEHNAILDNCHVRVAFATNDERTAKRISDALGTATEQRAMRNYAGHRLAPWLAHVMVSRQETARALLTPGEVMQLSSDEELVLVAGLAPVRARKLRYYEDGNFTSRIQRPPMLSLGRYRDRPAERTDDWAAHVRAPHAGLASVSDEELAGQEGGLEQQRHPGLADAAVSMTDASPETLIDIEADADDVAADQQAMDRARGLTTATRGYALNESSHRDLIPGL
jgi:type IV secretion system protein VirD4